MPPEKLEFSGRTCFVVMPYGRRSDPKGIEVDFDDVYRYVMLPPIQERLGLEYSRADLVPSAGWIHRDMLTRIARSDVVLVDISMGNPNVFYELGIRHSLRKGVTVLMQHKGMESPFNVRGMRTIEYSLHVADTITAQGLIEAFVRNGLTEHANDSLVYDVFP